MLIADPTFSLIEPSEEHIAGTHTDEASETVHLGQSTLPLLPLPSLSSSLFLPPSNHRPRISLLFRILQTSEHPPTTSPPTSTPPQTTTLPPPKLTLLTPRSNHCTLPTTPTATETISRKTLSPPTRTHPHLTSHPISSSPPSSPTLPTAPSPLHLPTRSSNLSPTKLTKAWISPSCSPRIRISSEPRSRSCSMR